MASGGLSDEKIWADMSHMKGTIETPINEDDLQGPKRKMMEERIPLGRFGRPEDIAEPVCFMASDMAKYSKRSTSCYDPGASAHKCLPFSHRSILAR